jgi:hypothetical protein
MDYPARAVRTRQMGGERERKMKIRDKKNKALVDVSDQDCPKRSCYWPRPDPGVFTQGVGYRSREGSREWLCGMRELSGCPTPKPLAGAAKGKK